jgi:Protein of unknown function (DUF3039)
VATHFIPPFAPRGPYRTQMALCGAYADPRQEFSATPTCPDCREILAEEEEELRMLREEEAR